MWIITTFQPVSLISLKVATATSTGGKSLLVPTPYTLKMALLNTVIQQTGVAAGERLWPTIRDTQFSIKGPERIAVTNTFTKILKPMKGKPSQDVETGLTRSMINTIGFREYVQWQGKVQIAAQSPATTETLPWQQWLTSLQYFGKRGGFVQAIDCVEEETLPEGFTSIDEPATAFALTGTLQLLDDCADGLTFEQVDIYSGKNLRTGKDRLLRPIILPYRVARSSRGYTLYERID